MPSGEQERFETGTPESSLVMPALDETWQLVGIPQSSHHFDLLVHFLKLSCCEQITDISHFTSFLTHRIIIYKSNAAVVDHADQSCASLWWKIVYLGVD